MAISYFMRIISTGDTGWVGFTALGCMAFALSHVGQLNQAFEFAQKALTIAPQHSWVVSENGAPALIGLALIHGCRLEITEFGETLDALESATLKDPWLNSVVVILRGEYCRMVGDFQGGLDILELAGGPDVSRIGTYSSAVMRLCRATLLVTRGSPGAGLRELTGLVTAPNHIVCWNSIRGLAYLALGLPHLAVAETEICAAEREGHSLRSLPEVLAVRAAAYLALERRDTAVTIFSEICAMFSDTGCNGLSMVPKSQLIALISEATNAGITVLTAILEAVSMPSNNLDAVLSTVGSLTPSERRLLWALRGPDTLGKIATRSFVSRATIKNHSHRIQVKLGVSSRQEAIQLAEQCGFFEFPTVGD